MIDLTSKTRSTSELWSNPHGRTNIGLMGLKFLVVPCLLKLNPLKIQVYIRRRRRRWWWWWWVWFHRHFGNKNIMLNVIFFRLQLMYYWLRQVVGIEIVAKENDSWTTFVVSSSIHHLLSFAYKLIYDSVFLLIYLIRRQMNYYGLEEIN